MRLVHVILLTMMTAMVSHAAVTKASFGAMPDGRAIDIYTLKSAAVEARIMTYGARVVSLKTADRDGHMGDVVLGYNTLGDYLGDGKTYFGAIVGRYGNRLAHGQFKVGGQTYQVPQNNNGNSLHGGTVGFDSLVWAGREIPDGVEMTLVSKDGDMGFPGTLTVHVRYTLRGNALHIDYSATTDKTTVINITNHSYFNLGGDGSESILDEELTLDADQYTPVDAGLIPTGELAAVKGTPFDFTKPTRIGARINQPDEQLKIAGGYDHNWVLRGPSGVLKQAAKVHDPKTGRTLTVTTTEPGVQFYSGNFLDGTLHGKTGGVYGKNSGLCLETQHFPDSPNRPSFPSTELKPGQTMHSTTVFAFSAEK